MTSKNIAVIFGPTLLRDQDENRDLLEMNHKISIIEFILNHMDTLFIIETIMGSATNTITSLTATDHRRMHLPPLQRGEDLNKLLSSFQAPTKTEESCSTSNNSVNGITMPAVPPRQNAGYI
jgi:hypothetical protein